MSFPIEGIHKEEAQNVADNLEAHYDRIRVDLNDPDHEIIQVFIHPTQTDFNKGTGLFNSTANGMSIGPNKFHVLWSNWFNGLLPDDPIKTALHEFTHCFQLNILIKKAQEELTLAGIVTLIELLNRSLSMSIPNGFGKPFVIMKPGS